MPTPPTDSQPISAETLAGALDGTEYGPVVQGGANRRQLNSQLLTYIQGAISIAQSQVSGLVTALAGKLAAASNLSDVANAGTARTNLGAAPNDASFITTAAESGLSAEAVLGTGVIMSGLASARPAAGTAGRLYYATDTGDWSRDNGSTWDLISTNIGTLSAASSVAGTDEAAVNQGGTTRKATYAQILAYIQAAAGRSTFSNANYTVLATDRYVAQVGTLSASRTATLPAASSVAAGYSIVIADESGTVTSPNTIVIARAGSDTINGATSYTITTPYASIRLTSDGSSKWFYDVQGPGRGGTGVGTSGATANTVFAGPTSGGAALPAMRALVGADLPVGAMPSAQTLVDQATVTWDVSAGAFATLTLGGNRTMAAPTNLVAGASYALKVAQDGTGSRTLTWNAVFKWPSGTAPTLSTAASAVDIVTFISDGTNLYGSALKTFS